MVPRLDEPIAASLISDKLIVQKHNNILHSLNLSYTKSLFTYIFLNICM